MAREHMMEAIWLLNSIVKFHTLGSCVTQAASSNRVWQFVVGGRHLFAYLLVPFLGKEILDF